MSPRVLVLLPLDVCGDVRLRPPLMGLQSDLALFAQRGDLSPAAGWLEGLGGAQGCGGGGRAEVDERGSDELLRGKSVNVVLNGETVVVV